VARSPRSRQEVQRALEIDFVADVVQAVNHHCARDAQACVAFHAISYSLCNKAGTCRVI